MHEFCRMMLKQTMEDVRQHSTVEQRKGAWAWADPTRRDHYEWHGPDSKVNWHGTADCKWDASQKGWSRWLEEMGVEGYQVDRS